MNETPPTPYPDLNDVLRDLVDGIQAVLGANFIGAYLQGSFAVGDFDLNSDVDFIIVIHTRLSSNEVQALQVVHERIFRGDIAWAQHLEGSYFPKDLLRDYTQVGKPLWYLDHGSRSLIQSDHCNTSIVRRIVRDKGVTLAGPPPATLVDPIPVEVFRKETLATMRDWGQDILTNSASYNNRFYQGFIVLNYCRMLHDLGSGVPGSKRAGAKWAKANLDSSWAGLIDRSWSGRYDPAVSSRQPADPVDFNATLEFVKYIINHVE